MTEFLKVWQSFAQRPNFRTMIHLLVVGVGVGVSLAHLAFSITCTYENVAVESGTLSLSVQLRNWRALCSSSVSGFGFRARMRKKGGMTCVTAGFGPLRHVSFFNVCSNTKTSFHLSYLRNEIFQSFPCSCNNIRFVYC